MHEEDPAAEYLPATQVEVHAAVAPEVVEKYPAVQLEQLDCVIVINWMVQPEYAIDRSEIKDIMLPAATLFELGPVVPLYDVEVPPVVTINKSYPDSIVNAAELRVPATSTLIVQTSLLL